LAGLEGYRVTFYGGRAARLLNLRLLPLLDELTTYDLFVLKGHKARPRRESEVEQRRVALLKLSRLGYLRFSAGVYSITPAGRRMLEASEGRQ